MPWARGCALCSVSTGEKLGMNITTRLRSTGMRYFSSEGYQEKQRSKARRRREQRGDPPIVHYFHQVGDPYSHLAVQKLDQLDSHYDLIFQPHLVSRPDPAYLGSAAHFDQWAVRDAESVATDYGTTFSPSVDAPSPEAVASANQTLAVHLDQNDFAQTAISVGEEIWSGQSTQVITDTRGGEQAQVEGNALRGSLGHYQGAMFYFDGEWFWGVDRIRSLEERLISEGMGRSAGALCVPEPSPLDTSSLNTEGILLEYFPSLRSPYTAIGHGRVLDLIEKSRVEVEVRPVMPMLMRGIPAPREKQRYIISDAGREGRTHRVPFGRIVDPFGEPVKRAFALYAAAATMDGEMAFVTAYLNAAWFDGIDVTRERGLKQVAAHAGLDWDALLEATRSTDWEAVLANNLNTMLEDHLWGVPSFRVSGGSSDQPYACWGQDRIWRVENEIARRT